MTSLELVTCILLLIVVLFFGPATSFGSRSRSAVSIRPPIDSATSIGKGGENGHRLLTAEECSFVANNWQRKIGVMDSGSKMELFEILTVRLL